MCSLENCPYPERPVYAKGLCSPCYKRTLPGYAERNAARERARRADPVRGEYVRDRDARRRRARLGHSQPTTERRSGACEVCGAHQKVLCLDHCHATGRARGWLCTKCNTALGMVGDSIVTLKTLISYLERR